MIEAPPLLTRLGPIRLRPLTDDDRPHPFISSRLSSHHLHDPEKNKKQTQFSDDLIKKYLITGAGILRG